MYYKLKNFYQNHRSYVRSIEFEQYQGNFVPAEDLDHCVPYIGEKPKDGGPIKPYLPCGSIANSIFNDSFTLSLSGGESVPLTGKNIARPQEISRKYGILTAEGEFERDICLHADTLVVLLSRTNRYIR